MTTELYWMTLAGPDDRTVLGALCSLPLHRARILAPPAGTQPEGNLPQSVWAQRAIRAHQNAVENCYLRAAVLTAAFLQIPPRTPATRMAVVAYFFARLAHFIVYTSGVPVVMRANA